MSDYLCVRATLLTGRYHPGDWPPSPARLLRALLAGGLTGARRTAWESWKSGLLWLENQPPPQIIATPAINEPRYRLAVPNNDLDVAARKWVKGKPYDAAELKSLKTITPTRIPGPGPHLHYLWPYQGDAPVPAITSLTHALHTLGWGIDVAFADTAILSEIQARFIPGDRYLPADVGDLWEIPVPGFLDDQLATFERQSRRVTARTIDPNVHPSVYALQHYRRDGETLRPWAVFRLNHPDKDDQFLPTSWHDAAKIAARMRHAAAVALRGEEDWDEERIARYIQGHDAQDPAMRLSFLPLPSIGAAHTDGMIRRVAVVEPLGAATGALPLIQQKLEGEELTPLHPTETSCRLHRPRRDDPVLHLYRRSSPLWRSVTPVILHGYNSNRGRISLSKTEKLLIHAFEQADFPARLIRRLTFQPAPLWPGVGSVFSLFVPQHLSGYPRYHVSVEFTEAVGGPILAGLGRHYGLGLFARVW
jgi:CRISPR-associated protein Csb2